MNSSIAAFDVIDKTTGLKPDLRKIALEEDWAKNLIYCDMDGFMFDQDGSLYLVDDCNNLASCPEGRFEVTFKNLTLRPRYVIADNEADARINLQVQSFTYRTNLDQARALHAELSVQRQFKDSKVFQEVLGAVEVE